MFLVVQPFFFKKNMFNKKVINVASLVQMKLFNYLSFDRHFARFVWNIVRITFGIQPPANFANLLGSWLHGLNLKLKNQILLIRSFSTGIYIYIHKIADIFPSFWRWNYLFRNRFDEYIIVFAVGSQNWNCF